MRRAAKGHSIIPGYGLTMGITVTMMSVFILIPLASILVFSTHQSPADFVSVVTDDAVRNALITSVGCAFVAALINCIFGLIIAMALVRTDFPGKRILDGMIELPLAIPTAVAGITLSKLYSDSGWMGQALGVFGIKVSYTHLGIIVALIFVGIPFTVRTVQPVLEKLSPSYEEAAFTLGASRAYTLRRVVLPEVMPALLTGFSLAFARGIGEYGSVIYISGNSAKNKTQVISYVIMQKLNYMDYASATAIALIMVVISFIMLLMINAIAIYQAKKTEADYVATAGTAKEYNDGTLGKVFVCLSVIFVFVMLVMPLLSLIRNAFSRGFGFYVSSLSTDFFRSALFVTILAAVIALAVNTFFGLSASWLLTRFSFRGRQVLAALIDIPFSISPVIAGLSYIMTFGRLGWAYPIFEWINDTLGTDIQIVFALPGVVLATIFVTFPFVSRELIPVMNSVGTAEEEAAAMMGAPGLTIYRRITFPHIKWPLVYGMILCTARALGEFGAVSALSKTRGETFTLPLEIDALYMSGSAESITAAFAVSSVLVVMAIILLVLRNIFEHRSEKK